MRAASRSRRRGLAELPPLPTDPVVCRWCGGRLRALLEGEPATYCQNRCATNDAAPYFGHCDECGADFWTGKVSASTCYECDQADLRRQPNDPTPGGRSYHFSRFGRGGYRD